MGVGSFNMYGIYESLKLKVKIVESLCDVFIVSLGVLYVWLESRMWSCIQISNPDYEYLWLAYIKQGLIF
jgi:hypothetical protein